MFWLQCGGSILAAYPWPGAPQPALSSLPINRTGRENLKESMWVGTRAGHHLLPSWAQQTHVGETIANETEQGNEELICPNRSLTVPFPHLSLLPRLSPTDFSTSFISSADLCIYMVVCHRFLFLSLAAAVQQFFPFLKDSS